MDISDYYTVREASEILHVTQCRVHQLIKEYGLSITMVGVQKMIPRKELKKIPKERKPGRPPGFKYPRRKAPPL